MHCPTMPCYPNHNIDSAIENPSVAMRFCISCQVSYRSRRRFPPVSKQRPPLRHRSRPFPCQLFQRLLPIVLHHSSQLEMLNLQTPPTTGQPIISKSKKRLSSPRPFTASLPSTLFLPPLFSPSPLPNQSIARLSPHSITLINQLKPYIQNIKHTQLAAHSLSNPFPSTAHTLPARSSSLTLSMMPLRSRQAKKSSRARQQCARDWRSGASKAPSGEGTGVAREGAAGEGEEEEVVVKRPIGFV